MVLDQDSLLWDDVLVIQFCLCCFCSACYKLCFSQHFMCAGKRERLCLGRRTSGSDELKTPGLFLCFCHWFLVWPWAGNSAQCSEQGCGEAAGQLQNQGQNSCARIPPGSLSCVLTQHLVLGQSAYGSLWDTSTDSLKPVLMCSTAKCRHVLHLCPAQSQGILIILWFVTRGSKMVLKCLTSRVRRS